MQWRRGTRGLEVGSDRVMSIELDDIAEAINAIAEGRPVIVVDDEERENEGDLVLAAAKTAVDTESSGSQFYITVGNPHHLDGVHTIFGAVISGQAVVDEIAAGEIETDTTDRPRDPVVVNTTEVL